MNDATSAGSLDAAAILLDLDGVLVESAAAVERHWRAWAARREIPADRVLVLAHGAPSDAVIAEFVAPGEVADEYAWLERLVFNDPGDDDALPGALAMLEQHLVPVAIVTSASQRVARYRLERAGLPVPGVIVASDDVAHGKPSPDPYVLGAFRLGVEAVDCVAVEDSPTGARAAIASGATTIAVLTSHRIEQFVGVETFVPDLSYVRAGAGGVTLLPVRSPPA